ncbi:MAG: hypothetical protein GQ544_06145 [Candidatus Aminicenantes bacterium]|nr:hypothetical protein [Candidatus Aminicenantes bacterium]
MSATRCKSIFSILVMLLFFLVLFSEAQLSQDILDNRAKFEALLKKGEIVKHVDIGEGINNPKRLFLKLGNVEGSGAWKNVDGVVQGYKDKWRYEVAAYIFDRMLGLDMVPPTVEKRFRTSKGSLQLWVALEMSELDRIKNEIPIPDDKQEHYDNILYIARAFDSLIGNIDRTQQNIRWTKDWRLILIDHSRAFRTKRIYTDQLVYGRHGLRKTMRFERLPKILVQRIKGLDSDKIKAAVGDYLGYEEIQAVLKRKKLLLKEIDELVKERGEEHVLY